MAKVGRKLVNLVYDSNNEQVVGLYYDSGANTYYARQKEKGNLP
jgi:hypothetical protein